MGHSKGITLIDAKQMVYRYRGPRPDLSVAQIPEERKELMPKCDICKVTIKRTDTITVKCCGSDPKEVDANSMIVDEEAPGSGN